MAHPDYKIKTMSRHDFDVAIEWAANEGWNPGLHDGDAYYGTDNNGFLMGWLGDVPVSSISVVKYGQSFGFLGFYIVTPENRGKGYGYQIWQAGMEYLKGRNVALDGVVDQQENYRKSGFNLAFRNIRFEGVSDEVSGGSEEGVIDLRTVSFESVDNCWSQYFPEHRQEFNRAWLKLPESYALGILEKERFIASGVIRRCRAGYKIGPLFAESAEAADRVFTALVSRISPGEPVFLDVPELNKAAVSLAEKYNMKLSFETARMYTGEEPDISLNETFGITSFEVG